MATFAVRMLAGLVVCLLAAALPASAAEPSGSPREKLDRVVPWAAGGVALVGSAWLLGNAIVTAGEENALFTASSTLGPQLIAAVPAAVLFTTSSWFVSRWFERSVLRLSDSWWSAVLWGAGLGAVSGAAIAVPGWTWLIGSGVALDIVTTGDMSYPAVLGMSVFSGAFWGALSGVIPGAILGPTFQWIAER